LQYGDTHKFFLLLKFTLFINNNFLINIKMDTIETKAHTLWNLYRNNEHAASVMSDVEHMRRRADTFGVGASLAIFGINITTRMTMRSRKYI
jgi:hypothetical protein